MPMEDSPPFFEDMVLQSPSPISFGPRHSCPRHEDVMMRKSSSNVTDGGLGCSQSHDDNFEEPKENALSSTTSAKTSTEKSCGNEIEDACEEGLILWSGHKMRFAEDPSERIQDIQLDYRPCLTAQRQPEAKPEVSLVHLPYLGRYEKEMCGPVLLICNFRTPYVCCFSPYTKSTFYRESIEIDIDDVLYSNGSWFLLREENIISLWNVNTEKRWFVGQVEEIIHQGYFTGNPPSDVTIALAQQHPPKLGKEAVTAIWLRSVKTGGWSKGLVKCTYEHRGLNSLAIHQGMVFWLTDSGSLCCVRQKPDLELMIWKGSVRNHGTNFSLVKHFNELYIVNSGSFFPNELAKTYLVIFEGEPLAVETELSGKDVFTVSRQGGFVLPSSQTDDCQLFTGNMIPDVDCAMYSQKYKCNEVLKRCHFFHHASCTSVWAIMRTQRRI